MPSPSRIRLIPIRDSGIGHANIAGSSSVSGSDVSGSVELGRPDLGRRDLGRTERNNFELNNEVSKPLNLLRNSVRQSLTTNQVPDTALPDWPMSKGKVRPYVSETRLGAARIGVATKRNVANLAKKAPATGSAASYSQARQSTVSSSDSQSIPNKLEPVNPATLNSRTQDDFLFAQSPAKLNLSLRILGKRNDGFHELETVMIPINLYDQIGIRKRSDGNITLSVECNIDSGNLIGEDFVTQIPTGEDNLIVKVAKAFQQTVGSEFGAEILLRKVIPAGGGLAGASTNAATTLRLLNQIWETRWGSLRLANFAAKFGSDIPFFFSDCAAFCSGRGEKIAPSPCDASVWMVVIRPNFGLSTPKVFQELGATPWQPTVPADPTVQATGTPPIRNLLKEIASGRWTQVGPYLQNDLRRPAVQIRSELKTLEARLRRTNPIGYQMSGSGSCYFAVYRNRREAFASAKHLRNLAVGKTFVVRPANRTLIA